MKYSLLHLTCTLSIILAIAGCDSTEYPPEPEITWNSFNIEYAEDQNSYDSVFLIFNYVDGDGDLGLDNGDSIFIHPDSPLIRQVLFLEYWQQQSNGEFTRQYDGIVGGPKELDYEFQFPRLNKSNRNKAIRGEIQVRINPWGTPLDSVLNTKYKIRIMDRAGNLSNQIESEIIPYQTPKF